MNHIATELHALLESFNESIRDALVSNHINASGEASKSLRVSVVQSDSEVTAESIGIFYLEFLNRGRGPGNPPPLSKLVTWAKIKYGVDDDQAQVIAGRVAAVIAAKGTVIFRENSKGIEVDAKVSQLGVDVKAVVAGAAKFEVKQVLDMFLKEYKRKHRL